MANERLENRYFFKINATDNWQDFCNAFLGVKVLSITGFDELGDAVNVYNEQWMESQQEDFLVTGESGKIIRKNVDLSMTIIISRRYIDASTHDSYSEMCMYKQLVNTLLSSDFYVHSSYTQQSAHVVCNKGFKPTTTNLQRGAMSYILVTIPLHCLDNPTCMQCLQEEEEEEEEQQGDVQE